MLPLTRRFFRRSGDHASSRGSFEDLRLSDGTRMTITVEVTFYPKDRRAIWYLGIGSWDKNGKLASESRYGRKYTAQQLKAHYALVMAQKGTLTHHPAKVRQRMLHSWVQGC